jgi:type IV secretory pathway TraG/TraD family ATPase VirD4
MSDELGTPTETRDAKNDACHRLSLWLGQPMMYRQQTARPLLTPGEVMQLPHDGILVLVYGGHQLHAKNARHDEDRQYQARTPSPPVPAAGSAETLPWKLWMALKPTGRDIESVSVTDTDPRWNPFDHFGAQHDGPGHSRYVTSISPATHAKPAMSRWPRLGPSQ